jgi:hypothetical protein
MIMSFDAVIFEHSVMNKTPRVYSPQMSERLAATITKTASKQTYFTVRYLVDRERIADAYRAYAYFRWVDDWLDQQTMKQSERIAFVQRQIAIVECGYQSKSLPDLTLEECMLINLLQHDKEANSGLQAYVRNMMAVMAFDAKRQGHLISEKQLTNYSLHLATAVQGNRVLIVCDPY